MKRPTYVIVLLLQLTLLAAPGYSQTQAANTTLEQVLAKLSSIEQRLTRIEAQLGETPEPTAEAPGIASRIENLDQQIRIVDRRCELDQEAQAARVAAAPVLDVSRDGFVMRSADSNFQLKLGGYMEADSRFFTGPGQLDASTLLLRRVRPIISGTVYKNIEFRIMTDFGLGATVLQDAHLDLRYFPKASLRFGKFKSPFGLERLQSAADITFVERSLATNLVPNRDHGMVLFGDLGSGTFSYSVGVMNGVPDLGSSDADTNDGKDLVGRLFVQPFIRKGAGHPFNGLGFGFAASHGRQDGTVLPTYKSGGQSSFFNYATGSSAAGLRQRFSPQAYYYVGSLGILAEFVATEQNVRKGSASDIITNHAWHVATSYLLTGEKKSYRSVSPIGKGALEFAARYAEVSIDRAAFQLGFADATRSAQRAREWTAGVNWHFYRSNKLVLNYEQTHFAGGSANGSRKTEKAILTRFQVAF